ncbi:MAG: hypothetical protein DWQ01_13800 [Planctomycetota bacterium]|nr:MAG: hypothetical protein DWQ01_13800 [Planctomycetota bacterium]
MDPNWKFSRRQGACAHCEQDFVEGQTVFSLLRFSDEALQRGDLCSDCFDQREAEKDLFFWRTTHQEAKNRSIQVDFDVLLMAVQKLRQDPRDLARDLCFLMALLLVRHRRLRFLSVSRKQGKEFLHLRKVRTQKVFAVEVRELDEDRRQRLSRALTDVLDPTREQNWESLLNQVQNSVESEEDASAASSGGPLATPLGEG